MSKPVSEALRKIVSLACLTPWDLALARQYAHEALPLAEAMEQENARLSQLVEAMTDPGKAPAIVRGMFEFAEAECGHRAHSSRHALTSIMKWVANAKQENEQLKAERDRLREALELWEYWYSEDSSEFNRETARAAGLAALHPTEPEEKAQA